MFHKKYNFRNLFFKAVPPPFLERKSIYKDDSLLGYNLHPRHRENLKSRKAIYTSSLLH